MILFLEKNNALCPKRVKDKQTKKSIQSFLHTLQQCCAAAVKRATSNIV